MKGRGKSHLQGGLDSKFTLGEIVVFLGLLDSLLGELLGSQSSSDGSGLLLSQIHGDESLASVLLLQLGLGGLVVHSQHAGDGLADNTDLGKLGSSTSGHLGDAKLYHITNN